MKTMIAKYPGTCARCAQSIRRGDLINFYGHGRAEHAHHDQTTSATARHAEPGPDRFDMMVEDNMAAACGL